MPTREELMDKALPHLAKRLKGALTKRPAWRSLFDVFGADKEDPARQRIRVVGIESKSLPPPPGLPGGAKVSHLTGNVAGSTTVRTTLPLSHDEVVVAGTDDSTIDLKIDELYSASGRAANSVLYDGTKAKLKVVDRITTKLDNLTKRLPDTRTELPAGPVDLLVSVDRSVTITGDLRKEIEKRLDGGGVVPVAGITDDDKAYVVPHQSGEIRIETVRAPAVSWEPGNDGGAYVVVSEEFIIVCRGAVRVCEVIFNAP